VSRARQSLPKPIFTVRWTAREQVCPGGDAIAGIIILFVKHDRRLGHWRASADDLGFPMQGKDFLSAVRLGDGLARAKYLPVIVG